MSNTISNDLAAQLQQLSTLQNDKNISADDKKKALEVAGAKTLAEINAQIPSLNFTSTKFAEKIAKIITEGNWNQLPNPEKLSVTLQDLRLVASAVESASNSMSVDMTSIMRLLSEAHRTLATIKSDENIENRKLKIKAADKEFEFKDKANYEQLAADLVSAIAEIVAGGVQLGGAGHAFKGALKNTGKAKDLLKKSHELSDISQKKNIIKMKLKDVSEKINNTKPAALKKMEKLQLEIDSPTTLSERKLEAQADLKIIKDDLGALDVKHKQLTKQFDDLSNMETSFSNEVAIGNEKLKSSTQKYEGIQQITNSSATIAKGLVQVISATMTFMASTSRLEADKFGLVKDLAGQYEQSAMEAYRNMNEGFRNLTQSLSAMEQSLNSSVSHMVTA